MTELRGDARLIAVKLKAKTLHLSKPAPIASCLPRVALYFAYEEVTGPNSSGREATVSPKKRSLSSVSASYATRAIVTAPLCRYDGSTRKGGDGSETR